VAKNLDELHARKGDANVFLDEHGQRVRGNWPDSPKPVVHDILTGSTADGRVMAGKTCNDWSLQINRLKWVIRRARTWRRSVGQILDMELVT